MGLLTGDNTLYIVYKVYTAKVLFSVRCSIMAVTHSTFLFIFAYIVETFRGFMKVTSQTILSMIFPGSVRSYVLLKVTNVYEQSHGTKSKRKTQH